MQQPTSPSVGVGRPDDLGRRLSALTEKFSLLETEHFALAERVVELEKERGFANRTVRRLLGALTHDVEAFDDLKALIHSSERDVVRSATEIEDGDHAFVMSRVVRLLAPRPDGLTGSEIRKRFERHRHAAVDRILDHAVVTGVLLVDRIDHGPKGGRPKEVYRLVRPEGGAA